MSLQPVCNYVFIMIIGDASLLVKDLEFLKNPNKVPTVLAEVILEAATSSAEINYRNQ